jgi:hypothetical protein
MVRAIGSDRSEVAISGNLSETKTTKESGRGRVKGDGEERGAVGNVYEWGVGTNGDTMGREIGRDGAGGWGGIHGLRPSDGVAGTEVSRLLIFSWIVILPMASLTRSSSDAVTSHHFIDLNVSFRHGLFISGGVVGAGIGVPVQLNVYTPMA